MKISKERVNEFKDTPIETLQSEEVLRGEKLIMPQKSMGQI